MTESNEAKSWRKNSHMAHFMGPHPPRNYKPALERNNP